MDDIYPDPIKNFTPRQGTPGAAPKPEAPMIDADTLSLIETMDAIALRSLIQSVSGAMWGIGLMTNEQRREAMKLKIAGIALTSRDNQTVLKACNDWLDREEGKAVQRIDQRIMNVHKGMAGEMSNAELLLAIQALKQLPEGVKLLENGQIEIDDDTVTIDQ